MVTKIGLHIQPDTVRAIVLWKKEISLSNPITHELVSNKQAYETILEDFAECYLKDRILWTGKEESSEERK